MGKITILPETTKEPISLIGKRAGVCWGADITDAVKNYNRGMDCIKSNHGRTLEYVNIELVIEGYSARVIREWYTHIGGSPTRLQASTRYINYDNFKYVTPHSIAVNPAAVKLFENTIHNISETITRLVDSENIPREDAAMLLPFCMETKIVDKRNLRNLIDMSRQRMCTRAYHEYRELFVDICNALSNYSDEWRSIIETQMKPKCELLGYCPEKNSCGRKVKRYGE